MLNREQTRSPVCGGPEPAAEGVVDEEVDAAVDDEAEVADAQHDAGGRTYMQKPELKVCKS